MAQGPKEITSADQHADRDGQTLVTRNHDVIRAWADARGAVPATVPGTGPAGELGVLRLDVPGYGGQDLQHVSWDDFFTRFDQRDLRFLYQERTKDGSESNFFRLERP
jgi:hypothetical protein